MTVHGKLINVVYNQENWCIVREWKKENMQSSKNIYKFYNYVAGNEWNPTEDS